MCNVCVLQGSYKEQRVYTDEVERAVRERGLRFFTPREIANLMCFPQEFGKLDGSFKDRYICCRHSFIGVTVET